MALRRSLLVLALAVAAAAALAQPASAMAPAPKIAHATMVYYVVGGDDARIRCARASTSAAPVAPDGSRCDAYTHWGYRWSWPGYGTSSCTLSQARVTVKVDACRSRAGRTRRARPPRLRGRLGSLLEALARHEKGHVDYAVAHYPAVVRAIKRSTCAGATRRPRRS